MIINSKPLCPDPDDKTLREPMPAPVKVKDMDLDYRPRERAKALGIGALKNAELFAIILRTGSTAMPVTELCKEMMADNGDRVTNLARKDRRELLQYRGIGPDKAMQIEAVMELIRRYIKETNEPQGAQIRSSKDIDALVRPHIGHLDHEEMWVLFLNHANKVTEMRCLNVGSNAATVVDVKRLMKYALLNAATSVALCHNHPSGTLTSSPQDDAITRTVKEACRTLDMRLIDHLIITQESYYSYNDHGRL